MITAYFMAPVRGPDGDKVSYEVKWENIRRARRIAYAIRKDFPELDLFIPHDHEIVIEAAQQYGATSQDILSWCCFIAAQREIGIRYEGHGVSAGMYLETTAMKRESKKICGIEAYPEAKETIAMALNDLRKE